MIQQQRGPRVLDANHAREWFIHEVPVFGQLRGIDSGLLGGTKTHIHAVTSGRSHSRRLLVQLWRVGTVARRFRPARPRDDRSLWGKKPGTAEDWRPLLATVDCSSQPECRQKQRWMTHGFLEKW